jgi:glycyl-tRNA synthetase
MEVMDDRLRLACAAKSDEEKAAFKAKTVAEWTARGKDAAAAEAFVEELFAGRYIPHVIEPSAGTDRLALALICNAYDEETLVDAKGKTDVRTVLRFSPAIAPVKVAVLPLVTNKPELRAKAREVYKSLERRWKCFWDETGAIGRRYRRQDEIGTPFCVTVDFGTLGEEKPELKDTVTLRFRDSMEQIRIPLAELEGRIASSIEL